jgi:hypothetical protein
MTDPLDKDTVVVTGMSAAEFDNLVRSWPDRQTAQDVADAVHERELARAAQPPVINVTMPGAPGHLSMVPGGSSVSWSPGDAPAAGSAIGVIGGEDAASPARAEDAADC